MILPSRHELAVGLTVCAAATFAPPARAQYAPPTEPSCDCGPSAMPAYVPSPQPARRPLDYSPRTGVAYRDGNGFKSARTDLGASSAPPYTGPALWSGLYLGGHLGYGGGTTEINHASLGSVTTSGGFGGVHLGFNVQQGAIVYGVEGDLSLNRMSGSKTFASGLDAISDRNWNASLRGRVGYAFGDALLYATGGVAIAEHEVSIAAGGFKASGKTMYPGFVIGGGLDWKFMSNVSLRTEILHYRFGTRDIDFGGASVPTRMDETVIRAGVTYHFN